MKKKFIGAAVLAALLSTGLVAKAVNFEAEVPEDVKRQAEADLAMVASIKASKASPLHQATFGAVDGKVYTDWFNARVEAFGYDPDDKSGAIAYNDSAWHPNHMMVTDYFVKGDLPQAARVIVLFHEARHSEQKHGYWYHATCPVPFIGDDGKEVKSIFSGLPVAGKAGCDRNGQGAYGTGSLMLLNIARYCENCSEKIKMDADLYGSDNVKRILSRAERQKLTEDTRAP